MVKKKIIDYIYLVLIIICSIILLLSFFGYEKISQCQSFGIGEKASDLYILIPGFISNFSNHRFLTIVIVSTVEVLLIVGRFLGFPYRKKVYIIRQIAYNFDTAPYDNELQKTKKVKEFEINQIDSFKENHLIDCLDIQDNILKIMQKNRASYYYGIAPIPFIFRLGFNLGDENRGIDVLHKKRQKDSLFSRLEDEEDKYKNISTQLTDNTSVNNKDLLVVIATSLHVNDNDIKIIYDKCCGKLIFNPEFESEYDFDYFSSYPQIRRTQHIIVDKIRKTIKDMDIKRIHFVLATSSDFVFSLSQMFSDYHDPEIVVYHFDCKNNISYPWGVIINKESENALIFN